jgi:4-hydroxythreonine-4-phosphate dehydrogenase
MDKASKKLADDKPIIGITLGDINGIGPEVIIKALSDNRVTKSFTPIIYGSNKVIGFYKKQLKLDEFNYQVVKTADQAHHKKINILNCGNDNIEVKIGESTTDAGEFALACLQAATQDLKDGHIQAVVTGPINKHNIQSDKFKFAGHTEYFAEQFDADDMLMLLMSEDLRVGVVTGHIPLKEVSKAITKAKILSKIKILDKSLKADFGITKPKIAVLGLNPHAGEDGLLGDEETSIIQPVINECKEKGMLVFGPYPADGFFGMMHYKKFDAVLAMYHDQGLIPFKTLAFETGINFTAGLPIVRTSPDHGTAYNIAGKSIASESSMREAIFLALDIIKNRQEKEN